ncbi:MAG: hypothetical protein GKR89_03250 [Candidatus Latescibacteria bacterium]|nr:hypothetical protein [Candidatus Latescibacterota bacterium]
MVFKLSLIGAFTFFAATGSLYAQVTGVVLDRATGNPVQQVRVAVQTSLIFVETGTEGRFSLEVQDGQWVVIAAAKKGYYTSSKTIAAPADGLVLELEQVPSMDNPDYVPVEPAECGQCHPDQFRQWQGSPMSEAGINAWVYDIYSGDGTEGGKGGFVYSRDSHFALSNPESECASCHQPESWLAEPFIGLAPRDKASPGALHGVSCEVCHKIAHIDESLKNYPGMYPGVVTWSRPLEGGTQVQYGVLGDATFGLQPLAMRPSYQPQLTAAACAACHQDKNDPDEDGDFEEDNGVISEPTYLEWLHSPYGDTLSPHYASCVDCHMPSYGAEKVCDFLGFPAPIRFPETVRTHRIEGTTPQFLENAVNLELGVQLQETRLVVQASIFNDQTGHHVPGGVSIRNMILLIEAWRAEDGRALEYIGDQVVHELGGIGDPAQGYYGGLPGKLYAKVMQDVEGRAPVFFTEAVELAFDNRIGAMQTDISTYTFAVPPDAGELHVKGRLIYRRSFRDLIDEKGWTQDGHGRPLADIAPPHFGHLMEESNWSSRNGNLGEREGTRQPAAKLYHNRPNPLSPFNSSTQIGFDLIRPARIALRIYDILGQEITTIAAGDYQSGYFSAAWDGTNAQGQEMATGVYVYRLEVGSEVYSQRLLLLR